MMRQKKTPSASLTAVDFSFISWLKVPFIYSRGDQVVEQCSRQKKSESEKQEEARMEMESISTAVPSCAWPTIVRCVHYVHGGSKTWRNMPTTTTTPQCICVKRWSRHAPWVSLRRACVRVVVVLGVGSWYGMSSQVPTLHTNVGMACVLGVSTWVSTRGYFGVLFPISILAYL